MRNIRRDVFARDRRGTSHVWLIAITPRARREGREGTLERAREKARVIVANERSRMSGYIYAPGANSPDKAGKPQSALGYAYTYCAAAGRPKIIYHPAGGCASRGERPRVIIARSAIEIAPDLPFPLPRVAYWVIKVIGVGSVCRHCSEIRV